MAVLCVRVLYRRWGLDGAILALCWRARWKHRERIMSLTALTGGAVHTRNSKAKPNHWVYVVYGLH